MRLLNTTMIVIASLFLSVSAMAAGPDSCESLAVSKDGKPLHGAAKGAYIKKCNAERIQQCEAKAIGKNGKPLSGAARNSFMNKCNADNGVAAYCEGRAFSKEGKPLSGAAKDASVKKCLRGG